MGLATEEIKKLLPNAMATKDLTAHFFHNGEKCKIGTFYVLESGIIVFKFTEHSIYDKHFWIGVVENNPKGLMLLCVNSIMSDKQGYLCITSPVSGDWGAEVKKRGFNYHLYMGLSQDDYVHFMLTEVEFDDLMTWLAKYGFNPNKQSQDQQQTENKRPCFMCGRF